jgi:ATP/maltotriose-dependent transcriptional regulator MalT/DNA-binding SARP family transcriptional activator
VDDLLPEVLRRRLTTVLAGPGFGKSALIAHWADRVPSVWYSLDPEDDAFGQFGRGLADSFRLRFPGLPADLTAAASTGGGPGVEESTRAEALVGMLCQALQEDLTEDVVLILDDVHEIAAESAAASLIEGLCRQAPDRLHVILASRDTPPFAIQRMRGRGQVLEVTARQLAFTESEVGAVLRVVALDPEGLALALHDATGGWPAAVHLAAEMLLGAPPERRKDAMKRLARPEGPIFEYLAEEVLRSQPPEAHEPIRAAAQLDRFTPELCAAIGMEGDAELLGGLERRGIFVESLGAETGWMRLNPMVREFLLEHDPVPDEKRCELNRRAADWLVANGQDEEALGYLLGAEDLGALARFLVERGERLIDAGMARRVVEIAERVPERTSELSAILGIAKQALGDWDHALRDFAAATAGSESVSARLAWREGLIHYLRGDPAAAEASFARGAVDTGETGDEAHLLAWKAALHWMRGDTEACRREADSALKVANASGDLRALAAGHTAKAMLAALEGDRRANDAHYLSGLEAAERAGDLFQIVRIRTNRASHLYEEGWYEQAREELDLAIRAGEVAGFTPLLALAYSNRGWVSVLEGKLDEAVGDFQLARLLYQRLDSRRIAYPLVGLAEVYRERGDLAQARGCYEEGIRQSEPVEDLQGLVSGLAGLARVMVVDDPEQANALCDRAMGFGDNLDRLAAVMAGGWVALITGNRDRGLELGRAAGLLARERRDRAGLAESLELQALAVSPPDLGMLEEAGRLWAELGNELASAKLAVVLERIGGARLPEGPSRAQQHLATFGVRMPATAAGPLAALPIVAPEPVSIRTLGGFSVVRSGKPVPVSEWQSKKSRDLLKFLVSRRGRPAHREVLIDALWPDENVESASNRLSVALSGVRAALDPDRRFGPDHYLSGDRESVGISTDHLEIDIERFLELVRLGRQLLRDGDAESGLRALESAEGIYAGDFLEEDAYEEWVVPLREEARAAYITATRALATAAIERGEFDTAIRSTLRILERDPYDEWAGLNLVRATMAGGRHGEARRHYRTYVTRMRELDVEPAPFPSVSGTAGA